MNVEHYLLVPILKSISNTKNYKFINMIELIYQTECIMTNRLNTFSAFLRHFRFAYFHILNNFIIVFDKQRRRPQY